MNEKPERHKRPPGLSWADFVEAKIREAQEAGEFDGLPGFGKPLNDLDPHDEHWWIRAKAEREELSLLPPALLLKRDIDREVTKLESISDETVLRQRVEEINEMIRRRLLSITWGPPADVTLLDADDFITRLG